MSAALPLPVECCTTTCSGSSSSSGGSSSSSGGVLQGHGHPALVYPEPPTLGVPWLYTDLDSGITYPWDAAGNAWIG